MRTLDVACGEPMCAAMKRPKKREPGPPVSARVVVYEVPAAPDEVLKRFKELALADALYDQAANDPTFTWHVSDQHSAASKLLDAGRIVQAAKKQFAGLRSGSESRTRTKERDYQEYRGIERRLIAEGRASRRTNRDRMAQLIQAELIKDGRLNKDGEPASTRTIKRAFSPKK
jgi:hypothetical protein